MSSFILKGNSQIEKEYLRKTKNSKKLDRIACKVLPGGSTRSATDSNPYPIYMTKGKGCYLTDVDGNEYIDFMNNYTVLALGHANPIVNKAIIKQTKKSILFGSPSENQYELGKIICKRVNSVERIRFCNTGTEAVMYAIRAARAVTGKNKILKMEGGFHGNTEQMEISVSPNTQNAGPCVSPIALPDTKGITKGVLQDILIAPFNNIEATEKIIKMNEKEIAAIILEPVMGYSGMIPATREFLSFIREITSKKNIIFILDEIITFRLSTGGAQKIYNVKPDLTTFGKIIGGGLPIGAFGGRESIMSIFSPKKENPMHHSGTFNGNAITMSAGIAAMKVINKQLINNINRIGEKLRKTIQAEFEKEGIRCKVSGIGSLMNIHFTSKDVKDFRSTKENWSSALPLRDLLNISLKNKGIYTPRRVMLCISSPMTENEFKKTIKAFRESICELKTIIENNWPELLE